MNSELKDPYQPLFNLMSEHGLTLLQGEMDEIINCVRSLDCTPCPSWGVRTAQEIYGYVFNGKFFKSLDDMRGMTMSEDNKPTPVFIHNQFAGEGWIENTITHLQDKIEPDADNQYFGSEYTKGRNDAFRLVINLLKKYHPSPPQNPKES